MPDPSDIVLASPCREVRVLTSKCFSCHTLLCATLLGAGLAVAHPTDVRAQVVRGVVVDEA